MPPPCAICTHPDRAKIEAILSRNRTVSWLMPLYGLSRRQLRYHKQNHEFLNRKNKSVSWELRPGECFGCGRPLEGEKTFQVEYTASDGRCWLLVTHARPQCGEKADGKIGR